MRPAPEPNVPGDTETERFDNAVKMFNVSKADLLEGRIDVDPSAEESHQEARPDSRPARPEPNVAHRLAKRIIAQQKA